MVRHSVISSKSTSASVIVPTLSGFGNGIVNVHANSVCTKPNRTDAQYVPGVTLHGGVEPKSVKQLVDFGSIINDETKATDALRVFGHSDQHINQYVYYQALQRTRSNMRRDLRQKLLELQTLRLKNNALKRKSNGAQIRRNRRATATTSAAANRNKNTPYKNPTHPTTNNTDEKTTMIDGNPTGYIGSSGCPPNSVIVSVPNWQKVNTSVAATAANMASFRNSIQNMYDSPVSPENTQDDEMESEDN